MIAKFRPFSSRRFSSSWWLEQGKAYGWVVLVTVLIWIYADMEFTETREFTTTIHLGSAPNSKLVLSSQNDQDVVFHARGNRSSLEQFENIKKAKGNRLDVDLSGFQPGANDVSVEDLLLRDTDFVKSGLTIASASPSRVQFNLDRMITIKDVRVELDFTSVILARDPVITPGTMSIQVAQSKWNQIRQGNPTPVLRTASVNLQKVATDLPMTLDVVPSIGGIPVQPQQQTVKVEVQVKTLTEQMQLIINVRVVEPVSWHNAADNTWKEYELVRKDTLEWRKPIMVTGPKQDLEALKAREAEVTAFIALNEDDKKPTAWSIRPVTVSFPPDLQVKLAPGEKLTVQFKLVPIH